MKAFYLTIILISNLAFTSCNYHSSTAGKTIFNMNMEDGLTSLDPAFSRNQFAVWMTNQLFDGLVQIDDSLHLKPCVAKSWEISPDAKLYTFHLRSDVYFQD